MSNLPLSHQQQQLKETHDKQAAVATKSVNAVVHCDHQQLKEKDDQSASLPSSHAPPSHQFRRHQPFNMSATGDPTHQFDRRETSTSSAGKNTSVLRSGTYDSRNDMMSQPSHPHHGLGSQFHAHNMAPPPRRSPPYAQVNHQNFHQTPAHFYTNEQTYYYMHPTYGPPHAPYSYNPVTSSSAHDPHTEESICADSADARNMTPKQLNYAHPNALPAQAPYAASVSQQRPPATTSWRVTSDMQSLERAPPSLERTIVSNQLTPSTGHEDSTSLMKNSAPVTQLEVPIPTATSASSDTYSELTSSTPKSPKVLIPDNFLPRTVTGINVKFAEKHFHLAHIWEKRLTDENNVEQVKQFMQHLKSIFTEVHCILSTRLFEHLKSIYSNIFKEPVGSSHSINDLIVEVLNKVKLVKGGRANHDDVKIAIQFIIFPFKYVVELQIG